MKFKIIVLLMFFSIVIFCFMIKLPVLLRKIDLELHAIFYFIASLFLNVLFKVKKINTHLLIFGMLLLFSVLIEFAQEYSNILLNKRIHGRFDPNDIKFNLLGLFSFSTLWFCYLLAIKIKNNIHTKTN